MTKLKKCECGCQDGYFTSRIIEKYKSKNNPNPKAKRLIDSTLRCLNCNKLLKKGNSTIGDL